MATVYGMTCKSIRAAIDAGLIDEELDAGALAVLRRVAKAVDRIDVNGLTPEYKLDNVSIPTYLRYCQALGLVPGGRAAGGRAAAKLAAGQNPLSVPAPGDPGTLGDPGTPGDGGGEVVPPTALERMRQKRQDRVV